MAEQLATSQEEVDFYIEFANQSGVIEAGLGEDLDRLKVETQKAMNIATSVIRSMAYQMAHTIDEIQDKVRPDEVEVEFGLKLDLEAGAIVPIVAKTTAGGQFNIRFKWTVEKSQKASVLVSPTK